MRYHGFYVKFTPIQNIQREKKDGSIVWRNGFQIDIFSGESEKGKIDSFSAAVDFEILNDSLSEAEQFAKDVIDCEEKEYFRMMEIYTDRSAEGQKRYRGISALPST